MAKTASDTKAKHAAKNAAGKAKGTGGKSTGSKGTGGKGGTGKKAARAEMKAAAIAAAEKAARPDALGTVARATAENPPQEEDLAVATVRKVAIDQVLAALPPATKRVTAQERDRILRDRRAALQQRPLW